MSKETLQLIVLFLIGGAIVVGAFTFKNSRIVSQVKGLVEEQRFGLATLRSIQVGSSPTNGDVLQTDGTSSTWVATSSLGISGGASFGQAWEVDANGNLAPTTTIPVKLPSTLYASSTALFDGALILPVENNEATPTLRGSTDTDTGITWQSGNILKLVTGGASIVDLKGGSGDNGFVFNTDTGDSNFLFGGSGGYTFVGDGGNRRVGINTSGTTANIKNALDVNGAVVIGTSYAETNAAPTNGLLVEGNVGISTTSPYAKLSVTNTGTAPSFLVEDSASPDSTPFIIDASGNVGVGVSSTAGKMEISGSGSTSAGGLLRLGGGDTSVGANNVTQIAFGYNGTDDYPHFLQTRHNSGAGSSNSISFWTADGTQNGVFPTNAILGAVIRNGTFGVNELAPAYRIEANGTSGSGYFGLTNSTDGDILNVNSSGRVGIGTTSPYAKLSVVGKTVAESFHATSTTATSTFNGKVIMDNLKTATGGSNSDACVDATTGEIIRDTTGVCVVSSRLFKDNINTLSIDPLNIIKNLRTVSFTMKDDPEKKEKMGFIAEEAFDADPRLVLFGSKGEVRSLDDHGFLAILWGAVQKLIGNDERQDDRLTALEARLDALEAENKQLKANALMCTI